MNEAFSVATLKARTAQTSDLFWQTSRAMCGKHPDTGPRKMATPPPTAMAAFFKEASDAAR
jgi:hypothetical protein